MDAERLSRQNLQAIGCPLSIGGILAFFRVSPRADVIIVTASIIPLFWKTV
jgi:hypothetical protein